VERTFIYGFTIPFEKYAITLFAYSEASRDTWMRELSNCAALVQA